MFEPHPHGNLDPRFEHDVQTHNYELDLDAYSAHLSERGFTVNDSPIHLTIVEGVGLQPTVAGNVLKMLSGQPLDLNSPGFGEHKDAHDHVDVTVVAYSPEQATKTLIKHTDYAWNLFKLQGLVQYEADPSESKDHTLKYLSATAVAGGLSLLVNPPAAAVVVGASVAYAAYDHASNPHNKTAKQAVKRYFDPNRLLIRRV
jgi:hypothetical protein